MSELHKRDRKGRMQVVMTEEMTGPALSSRSTNVDHLCARRRRVLLSGVSISRLGNLAVRCRCGTWNAPNPPATNPA